MNVSKNTTKPDFALVTGASSGIGKEFVELLAEQGRNILLVARREDVLRTIAADVQKRYGIQAEVIVADLSEPSSSEYVFTEAQKFGNVDLLINNAGFGNNGEFHESDWQREHSLLQVNIVALVELTHRFLPSMKVCNNGGIINIASIVAYQPTPLMATYGASKVFVRNFSLALAYELRATNIRVHCCCPGATDTSFFDNAQMSRSMKPPTQSPREVAQIALDSLTQNKPLVVSGFMNKVSAFATRLLPHYLSASIAERFFRKG
jgi:short-subunit dehydrogenase